MTGRPGVDVPDHRGRTGLDRAGRDLTRNPDVVVRDVELTSTGWHVLRRTTYDYRRRGGSWTREQRETDDRGQRRHHPAASPPVLPDALPLSRSAAVTCHAVPPHARLRHPPP